MIAFVPAYRAAGPLGGQKAEEMGRALQEELPRVPLRALRVARCDSERIAER